MSFSINRILSLPLLLIVTLIAGCDRSSVPPEPITLDQLPAALDKAFTKASSEAKAVSAQVVTALNAKDYQQASAGLQKLSTLAGLNKEQASVSARGVLTVNQALQEAQTKGDQKATQTLKSYRINK